MPNIRMIAVATALLATTAPAAAQDWPAHRITLVVPFAAGGSSDVIARIAADGISNNLHQPVIVENVTGVGGLLGGARVAKAAPDGYEFLIGNVGNIAQSQWLYKTSLYDPVRDFAPITCSSSSPTRRRTRASCTSVRPAPAVPIILLA